MPTEHSRARASGCLPHNQGSRLLTVTNYEHYTDLMDGFRERMVRERARFIEDYDTNVDQARLDLGKLFRIEDYPTKEALQGKFSIRYLTTPARALTLLNVRAGRAALEVRVDRPDLHENEGRKNARRNNIAAIALAAPSICWKCSSASAKATARSAANHRPRSRSPGARTRARSHRRVALVGIRGIRGRDRANIPSRMACLRGLADVPRHLDAIAYPTPAARTSSAPRSTGSPRSTT